MLSGKATSSWKPQHDPQSPLHLQAQASLQEIAPRCRASEGFVRDRAIPSSESSGTEACAEGVGVVTDPLEIDVGFPAHELSPNARVHKMVEHRFKKAAKNEAGWATKIAMPVNWAPAGEKVKVHLVCHLAKGAKQWDEDNLVAAVKGHLDGIAEVIGINDRNFAAPTVEWAERTNGRGKMIVRLS
jgi:hypothetical protein